MAKRPRIGLTLDEGPKGFLLKTAYVDALWKAGAMPVALPPLPNPEGELLWEDLDGCLFTGGDDIPGSAFGEAEHPACEPVLPRRYQAEAVFMENWMARKKPTLGICLAMQWINVLRGGTLYLHLPDFPDFLPHKNPEGKSVHILRIAPDSLLAGALETGEALCHSRHHQGVNQVGQGLRPTAWAPDQLVEALEVEHHPWAIFVQGHPELPPTMAKLFDAFVQACATS